jgi:hypothetical protein
MAVIDSKLEIWDAETITGAAENSASKLIASNNAIDLGLGTDGFGNSITPDIGRNGRLWLNVHSATSFAAASYRSPLCMIQVWTHTTSDCRAGNLIAEYPMLSLATAGTTVVNAPIPGSKIKRFIGLAVRLSSTTITAGALDAWISLDAESQVPFEAL